MLNTNSKAHVPTKPSNEIQFLQVLLIGLAAAVAIYVISLIRFVLNDRLSTPEDVEHYLGLHVLGMVPDKNELMPDKNKRAGA